MIVTLAGNLYVVANDKEGRALVRQRYVLRQSNPQRLIGTVFRENDPSMGHYAFGEFPKGIGLPTGSPSKPQALGTPCPECGGPAMYALNSNGQQMVGTDPDRVAGRQGVCALRSEI